jgi:hypothetical protein
MGPRTGSEFFVIHSTNGSFGSRTRENDREREIEREEIYKETEGKTEREREGNYKIE